MSAPTTPPTAPVPHPGSQWRGLELRNYFWTYRDRYTEAALASAAATAGYEPDEIAAAAKAVATRRADEAAVRPVKAKARWLVLAGYGVTWLIFAFLFLRPEPPDPTFYLGTGPVALGILAFVMVIALLLGLAWVGSRRPPADRAQGALGVMLAVPFVLLIIVAGLCVTTTQPLIFGAR